MSCSCDVVMSHAVRLDLPMRSSTSLFRQEAETGTRLRRPAQQATRASNAKPVTDAERTRSRQETAGMREMVELEKLEKLQKHS
jgi:hypothetical protein